MFPWTKVVLACALVPSLALAQVHVEIGIPGFRWAAPPRLVVVEPGVEVVEDYDGEVFFRDGYYWSRGGDEWYRTRDYRGGWVVVPRPSVPMQFAGYAPGRFRHYRTVSAPPRRDLPQRRVERRFERRMERRIEERARDAATPVGHGHGKGHGGGRGNGRGHGGHH